MGETLVAGLEYRIRMIILTVRMMAIGAIILDRTPQKRARREIFFRPGPQHKKISRGGRGWWLLEKPRNKPE